MKRFCAGAFFLFFLLFCQVATVAAEQKSVVVTTNILSDLVSRIVGNTGDTSIIITTMMGPGVDPHLYKASQGDLSRLSKADLIFYNGLELEGKLARVLKNFKKKTPTVGVAESLPKSDLRSADDIGKIFDPHIWFDPLLWRKAIPSVVAALIDLEPASKAKFVANGEKLGEELITLHEWSEKELSKVPKGRRVLVTAHDAFGYFGVQYGFEVVGLQGVSTASEFGIGDLQNITSLVIERKIPAVFVESSVPKRFVEALVEGSNAKG